MTTKEDRWPPLALAAMGALLALVATYALLRAYDVLFKSEPNPATVLWSAHIAMFWRLGVGAYVAGFVGLGVYFFARRDLALTTRALSLSLPIVGAILALQAVLLP